MGDVGEHKLGEVGGVHVVGEVLAEAGKGKVGQQVLGRASVHCHEATIIGKVSTVSRTSSFNWSSISSGSKLDFWTRFLTGTPDPRGGLGPEGVVVPTKAPSSPSPPCELGPGTIVIALNTCLSSK